MIRVQNTTSKTMAVRVAGGHEVVKPGGEAEVDMEYDDLERARYTKAGLTLTRGKAKPAEKSAS